ncbi:uncharacterized protein MONBRDRAFT_22110 [Monosiga brevicollis MX1]|uniref:Glycoside hydrolase family 5 domain-containing protein n=1 Tax=Monosiga brevicollis TaxID=81824 RepID=A9UPL2_MONBE|nr:uncharacterized protein MONBRDRAFT_22110 [Monosiga brevicollis MX1]EDQ92890.1 predicted protein [Monosiga brevicollis MX1]|eukprot:XP_001742652.1 hypothetical protein [Monosiga brevicollis MX1]
MTLKNQLQLLLPMMTCLLMSTVPSQTHADLVPEIDVTLGSLSHSLPLPYVGVNIDAASLYYKINLTHPYLITAAQKLAPGILRVGGGMADSLLFNATASDDNGSSTNILTTRAWDDLVAFARQTGLQLLFDLNALGLRGANGAWDSTNAEQLLHYIKSHNQTDALYGFELGNEIFPTEVLRIVGPDVCCGFDYLEQFLNNVSAGTLDIVTVHSYPMHGPKANQSDDCNLDAFIDPAVLDRSDAILFEYQQSHHRTRPDLPLILGETATAGDGGCDNLSNRFVASFFWLDQLGRLATNQWQGVFRQDLVGWSGSADTSHYALLGPPGWIGNTSAPPTPHPDFFVTRLWNELVGTHAIALNRTNLEGLRVYAFCHRTDAGRASVAFVNLNTFPLMLHFVDYEMGHEALEYTLQSDHLQDDHVRLNDALLTDPTAALPGRPMGNFDGKYTAQPLTLGFVVIHAPVCA